MAGQCQPVALAQYTGEPDLIDVGVTSVYVSTDLGYIGKAAKDGSDLTAPQMPSFVTSAFIGTHALEDGDRVFFAWENAGFQLSFCLGSSCEATVTPIGAPYTQYFSVDVPDHRVAWIDPSGTQLLVSPTVGTITATSVTASGIVNGPLYYAAAGLFFVNGSNVERVPLTGGMARTASSGSGNGSVTVLGDNGSNLYFYDGSSIRFTPLPAGDGLIGQKLIDTPYTTGPGRRFAVDGLTAYWLSDGHIHTCQLSQCSATEQLVSNQATLNVEDIGIDETALYWVNQTDGNVASSLLAYFAVWKVAR